MGKSLKASIQRVQFLLMIEKKIQIVAEDHIYNKCFQDIWLTR